MNPSTSNYELISALADSQLQGEALEKALGFVSSNDSAMASWAGIHLIRDVLQCPVAAAGNVPVPAGSSSFLDRFNQALATTHPLAMGVAPSMTHAVETMETAVSAANDSVFRWKVVAGFATLGAVGVMIWTSMAGQGLAPSAQLAQQPIPAQILVASPQGIIVRDARLNELLAAHKQQGAGSALQAPSGFLQSAAFETTPAIDR